MQVPLRLAWAITVGATAYVQCILCLTNKFLFRPGVAVESHCHSSANMHAWSPVGCAAAHGSPPLLHLQIHKSQGLSIDYLRVDLSNTHWAPGMAYVALSRATSLEGLQILGHGPDCANRDPFVHRRVSKAVLPTACSICAWAVSCCMADPTHCPIFMGCVPATPMQLCALHIVSSCLNPDVATRSCQSGTWVLTPISLFICTGSTPLCNMGSPLYALVT
jgi:hypothetical protein